ncbi:MAG TPA: ABC transporter permease [Thermoanaerobaculia bacterium]|nr:ABC transporter permease [Thermoanaerobaculia bacterium]
MHWLISDLARALRSFTQRLAYSGAVIFSLGGAIGLSIVAFALTDGLFLRPLPIPNQDRIVALVSSDEGAPQLLPLSYPNLQDLQARSHSLATLSAYQFTDASLAGDPPQVVVGQIVTGSFFSLLGVSAQRGRTLTPADDSPSNLQPVVVLSDALWRQRFAGDPSILGRVIQLDRQAFTVVGICPPGFHGTQRQVRSQFWIPLRASTVLLPIMDKLNRRDWRLLRVLGLLAPHSTPEQARTEIKALGKQLELDDPDANRGQSLHVIPFADEAIGPNSHAAIARACAGLLTIAILVLLGAGINAANFLLINFTARRGEMGIRLALGAMRRRLILQFALEGLLLVTASLGFGTLLAYECQHLLLGHQNPFTGTDGLSPDWRLVTWVVGTALAVGVAGMIPVVRAALSDSLLKVANESRYLDTSRRHQFLQSALTSTQVAFTTVFLACAGWFTMSLVKAQRTDLGFVSQGLGVVSLNLKNAGYSEPDGLAFCERARLAIAGLPGVASVDIADLKPLSGASLLRQTYPVGARDDAMLVPVKSVTDGYFQTLGLRLLSGRSFHGDETSAAAVLNAELASKLWPGVDPVGRQLQFDDDKTPVTVVGVVGSSREISLEGPIPPLVYLPFRPHYSPAVTFYIRSSRASGDLLRSTSLALSRLDRQIPVDSTDIDSLVKAALWARTLAQRLFLLLGISTLLISMVATYVLTSFYVKARYRDLAIRTALGAEFASLTRLICQQRLPAVAVGLLAGALASFEIGRLISSFTGPLEREAWVPVIIALLTMGLSVGAIFLATRELSRSTLRASLSRL